MFRQLSGVSSLSAYCKLICSIMWTIALIGFYVVHHRSASFDGFSNWNRYLTVQYWPIRWQFTVWRILSCTTRSNNVSLFQNLHSIGTGFSDGTNMVDLFKLHFTFDCWYCHVSTNLCFDTMINLAYITFMLLVFRLLRYRPDQIVCQKWILTKYELNRWL